MSYETAKYILWVLMCIPVIWLSIYMINSVINDTISMKRRSAARKKRLAEERKQQQLKEAERRRFEDDYSLRSNRRSGR